MVIGITGNSGAGKSVICGELIKRIDDAVLIDADSIVKDMQKEGESYYTEIVNTFGECILNKDRTINRKALGDIVFSNREEKQKLDDLTRMYVVLEMNKKIEENVRTDFMDYTDLLNKMVKTEDIHPPKTGISVHFCVLSLMAMQK